jgi:galactose-1-phosphate uridylyltransferase
VAFPNLFSKASLDAVVVLDPALHELLPSRLDPAALASAFAAAAELVRRARARSAELVHHVAGMNFLPPGGPSVPHPHLQVHVRTVPYSGVARLVALGRERLERDGGSFWDGLLRAERGGPRWLGTTGPVEWLAAFAPSHQKEVWGVLPTKASLTKLTTGEAEAFAAGLARVVGAYEELGQHAFTAMFFSAPAPATAGHALQLRVCARPALKTTYANYDTWFAPLFAGDDAHTEAPEAYAARMRGRW